MKKHFLTVLICLYSISLFAQNQDCAEAFELLTKDSITVTDLPGIGETNEFFDNPCIDGENIESNSSWYKFTPIEAGTFNFIIKPIDSTNDLDFYMFNTVTGFCNGLISLRCNASSCQTENGHTGLSEDDMDEFEDLNCDEGENLFSSEVMVDVGQTYYLMVNNFTGNAGFTIVFCGTAILGEEDVVCTREPNNIKLISEKTYTISPNPSNGFFTINDYEEINELDVLSVDGKLQKSIKSVGSQLMLDLNPGMYYLKMKLKDGKVSINSVVIY
jgi:hypothetical protein